MNMKATNENVTMNYQATSDLLTEACQAHKKEFAALRALYNELGVGSELNEFRLAYIRGNFENLCTLLDIALDYHKDLENRLEQLTNEVESKKGIA